MKKIILLLLIGFLCGCSLTNDPYKDFEHYDLSKYKHREFLYSRDTTGPWYDNISENYAISLLIPKGEEANALGFDEGLFYQVDDNDYILIDRYYGDDSSYNSDLYTYYYKDKIYILRDVYFCEYTLNRENTIKNEITFDYSSVQDKYCTIDSDPCNIYGRQISKIDDEYVYFREVSIRHVDNLKFDLKCSLKDYICEEYTNEE